MINLVILGAGNLATHLAEVFYKTKDIRLVQVYNHNAEALEPFKRITGTTTDINHLEKADVYLIVLKDDVIGEVARKIPKTGALLAHTSGSAPLKTLQHFDNYGVFYPLQSFSKDRKVDFKEIPLCLEANSAKNLGILKALAGSISEHILEINSNQRKTLHLAAVYVNNFTNHLYALGAALCEKNNLSFDILKPLIRETASKIENLAPQEAQTGPALRNDLKTINSHLELLDPDQQNIYKTLTQSIQKFHGKKL